jgi:hypothetical protein
VEASPLSLLDVTAAMWQARLFDSRRLPSIAAELVASDVDASSLVELAGLDLGPFDPRDASDLLVAACVELGCPLPDSRSASVTAAVVLAWGVVHRSVPPKRAARLGSRAWIEAGYPDDPPELAELFMLEEEYDAGIYGQPLRPTVEIDEDVRAVAERLVATHAADGWGDSPLAHKVLGMTLATLPEP